MNDCLSCCHRKRFKNKISSGNISTADQAQDPSIAEQQKSIVAENERSLDAAERSNTRRKSTIQKAPAVGYKITDKLDWTDAARPSSHLWIECSDGTQCDHEGGCFIDIKSQPIRYRCTVCKRTGHKLCLKKCGTVDEQCKPTFIPEEEKRRDPAEYPLANSHHWMEKSKDDVDLKRCRSCNKTWTRSTKVMICSWCNEAYHNTSTCFNKDNMALGNCTLGVLANLIIPPVWIWKKSWRNYSASSSQVFSIKPQPAPNKVPLIALVNPGSGGNQGAAVLHELYTLLNPRQIFNLKETTPRFGLTFYRGVPNLHVLVCGGDGTVGWILNHMDDLEFASEPRIIVLPIGTGNDLARVLGWGGAYNGEPLDKLLSIIPTRKSKKLDRWSVKVTPLPQSATHAEQIKKSGEETSELVLQTSVFNNYFSIGADAHIQLRFHKLRHDNPARYSSRFRNRMTYAIYGGMDLLSPAWKKLSRHLTLECDGVDLTPKIRQLKIHVLLFQNIPRYSGGTNPWGNSTDHDFTTQRFDDGLLEVIGFTSGQLATQYYGLSAETPAVPPGDRPLTVIFTAPVEEGPTARLQIGGTGVRLSQCQKAVAKTDIPIPMQIDGEPTLVAPSLIEISRKGQAWLVFNEENKEPNVEETSEHRRCDGVPLLALTVHCTAPYHKSKNSDKLLVMKMEDLKVCHSHHLTVCSDESLSQLRKTLDERFARVYGLEVNKLYLKSDCNWRFLDSISQGEGRLLIVSNSDESLLTVTDVCCRQLYITALDVCWTHGSDDYRMSENMSSRVQPRQTQNRKLPITKSGTLDAGNISSVGKTRRNIKNNLDNKNNGIRRSSVVTQQMDELTNQNSDEKRSVDDKNSSPQKKTEDLKQGPQGVAEKEPKRRRSRVAKSQDKLSVNLKSIKKH